MRSDGHEPVIEVSMDRGRVVIRPVGMLDTTAAEALGDLLVGARAAGQDAVVDLADTDVGVYGARRQAALQRVGVRRTVDSQAVEAGHQRPRRAIAVEQVEQHDVVVGDEHRFCRAALTTVGELDHIAGSQLSFARVHGALQAFHSSSPVVRYVVRSSPVRGGQPCRSVEIPGLTEIVR